MPYLMEDNIASPYIKNSNNAGFNLRKRTKLVSARSPARVPVFLQLALLNLSGQEKQQHKTCGYIATV